MLKYELRNIVKKDKALANDGSTILENVIHRVDMYLVLEDDSAKVPFSMVLEAPSVEEFSEYSGLTKNQILSWITDDFTDEQKANMVRVLNEQKTQVRSIYSEVSSDSIPS